MEQSAKEEEGEESGVEDHWYLVDAHGQKFRLPKTMLFLGREECDVVVASQTVDKRHAVLTFDIYLNRFKVKDLSTSNGTFVNNQSIKEQEYVPLNHMDSVRLGNDTMMYHIEQGSQITSQGGLLPDHRVIPSWASRRASEPAAAPAIHVHAHAMAECQLHYIGLYGWFPTLGCIAEQNIEHSCGLHTDKSTTDGVHVLDPSHCSACMGNQPSHQNLQYNQHPQQMPCHHHHHQYHQPHPHHPQHMPPQQQPYLPHDPQSLVQAQIMMAQRPEDYHHLQHEQLIAHQEMLVRQVSLDASHATDDTQYTDAEGSDSSGQQGRNTWPRKRVRQGPQVPHVGTLFPPPPEVPEDGSDANGNEAKPSGPGSGMYFVSFDDSVCNGSTTDLTDTQRITRNSKNPPPKERTAGGKKGTTPLYGQPDWWGESEEAVDGDSGQCTRVPTANQENGTSKQGTGKGSRPSSLVIESEEAVSSSCSAPGSDSRDKHKQQQQHRPAMATRGSAYMEIPVHGDGGDSPADNAATPDGEAVPVSMSSDNLLSPDGKQQLSSLPAQDASPSTEKNPAMSFIVDLDDHPPRKINIGSSLSQFVPTKIRKSFLERKDKASATKGSSVDSTPSKNSEERDASPNNQRRIEEIWSSLECKGKPSQLSSVQATAGSSLRSPNLEELERLSELSEDRRSAEREVEKKGRKPAISKGSPKVSRAKVGSVKPVASVSLSQYSDTTNYLIDKMFEGGGDGSSSVGASSSSEKEMSPEQKMYKEAAGHDKPKGLSSKPPRSSTGHKKDSTSSNKSDTKPPKEAGVKTRVKSAEEGIEEDLKIVEKYNGGEDKEDKASEAGTYTIEGDEKEAEEEEMARKRIDEVFGVEGDGLNDSFGVRPVIDPLNLAPSPGGYDNVTDDDDDDEDKEDGDKTPLDESSMVDSLMVDENGDNELDNEDSGGMDTEGVQTWVSQLTALTSHKAAANISDSARQAWDEAGEPSLSKKPPHGHNRKRPGTGRKLPSIPTTDRSPVSSEHSSHVGEQDPSEVEDTMSLTTTELLSNSKDMSYNNRYTPTKSQVPSHISKPSPLKATAAAATTNGHSAGSPSGSGVTGKGQDSNGCSPNVSARSRGSVDTELLLQDTETVMAAMEARMAHKKSSNHRDKTADSSPNQDDSDTDVSSTVALVNGDEAYKPTIYKSPRDALSRKNQRRDTRSTGSASPSSTFGLKSGGKSQTVSSKSHSAASPRNLVASSSLSKKSVVSDVLSRTDSFDNDSIISDVGSDAGDSCTSRSSSKTKGAMSMTKPNRAFQLRRARADSTDEPTTPRSAKPVGRGGNVSARSSSVHSTSRTRSSIDTGRSEASLGAQIARKSRNNERSDKPRNIKSNTSMDRSDGGRHSLRMQRASSLTIAPQTSLTYPGKRETTPKSHLKSTFSSSSKGGLSITGVSSGNRPQSQPGSRSNSPKAAERIAWKRRKEYDPRKAVADAKAKSKDAGNISSASSTSSISMRAKPSTRENAKRRMIRSASFGNSISLHAQSHDSLSNSQGLGLPERKEHRNEEGFPRAFMPVRGSATSLRSDRSVHSADEDDTLSSVASTQTSYDNLIVSSIYQLSLKLSTHTDKTLNRLREEERLSSTPSPIEDFASDNGKSDIPAWKSANRELAGILKNLRKLERHVTLMNRVIFPEEDMDSDMLTGREKQKYFQEIERIRSELAGFHPIDNPRRDDYEAASPEMEEYSETF